MFKVKMIVSGRVQGVGFRYFVIISARELGILGRVWNNDDGTVEILAQTEDEKKLEEFTAIVRGEKSSKGRELGGRDRSRNLLRRRCRGHS